jgi:hypothetical protein
VLCFCEVFKFHAEDLGFPQPEWRRWKFSDLLELPLPFLETTTRASDGTALHALLMLLIELPIAGLWLSKAEQMVVVPFEHEKYTIRVVIHG